MFSQLLKLFPRTEFLALVKRTHAERHARGFTCWGQFVAMLFCQLGRAHSLREICRAWASGPRKLMKIVAGGSAAAKASSSTWALPPRASTWAMRTSIVRGGKSARSRADAMQLSILK